MMSYVPKSSISFIPTIISQSGPNFQRFGIDVGLDQDYCYLLDFINVHHLFYITQLVISMLGRGRTFDYVLMADFVVNSTLAMPSERMSKP